MKKVVFIIPYYGKLPPYFNMWLKTAKYNETIDFLIITDLIIESQLSKNINILPWSFAHLKEYIQSKFDFEISLERPYKLCDYRPVYGYVFQEFISEYDFWGYCDIDCIFGDIRKFLNPLIECYDAIGTFGHLSLYRNCEELNNIYRKDGALYSYQDVYSNDLIYAFDEKTGIKRILERHNINCAYDLECMADISTAHKNFWLLHGIENYNPQIFFWEKGKLWQCYYENNEIKYKEFLYLHFQKKCPMPDMEIDEGFYIFYDKMLSREGIAADIRTLKSQKIYSMPIFLCVEKVCWCLKKIIKYMKADKRQREIDMYKRKFQ